MFRPYDILWGNPCAGFTPERSADIRRVGDQGPFATILQKPDDGLDFWRHRQRSEISN